MIIYYLFTVVLAVHLVIQSIKKNCTKWRRSENEIKILTEFKTQIELEIAQILIWFSRWNSSLEMKFFFKYFFQLLPNIHE